MTRTFALALATLTAACGGLGTPDLATGEVRGRIVGGVGHGGGVEGGFVYPVGHPEWKARLEDDGSFRVKAPVGATELVLWDGKRNPTNLAAPFGRAGRLAVLVDAAEITEVGDQSDLPPARAILAGVRAESGAGCDGVRLRADLSLPAAFAATDQDRTIDSGVPSALLYPLPPGAYRLTVSLDGFRTEVREFDLESSGGTSEEFELEVDDDDDVRGCEVTGCESGGLVCCRSGDTGCPLVGRCYFEQDTVPGGCGAQCADGQCQAGLACTDGTCVPNGQASCGTYLGALGAACLSPGPCAALVGGQCDEVSSEHAGYCTAACSSHADCASFPAGWECDGSGYCEPHD